MGAFDNYPIGVSGAHRHFNPPPDELAERIPPWATCGNCGLRPACPEIQGCYWCGEGECYVRAEWAACEEWQDGRKEGRR